MKTLKQVAALSGHTGAISALAFSENGISLSSGDSKVRFLFWGKVVNAITTFCLSQGVVKIWDLRKLDKALNTLGDKNLNVN